MSVGAATIAGVNRTESRPAATLPPVALTPEQAAAVAVALAAQPEGPYAADGRAALEKVLAVLEPDPVRRAELLVTSEDAGRSAAMRSVVDQAVTRHRVLALEYRDGQGSASRREVEPQLLARSGRHWYLVAWCRDRGAVRWFREDRIERVEPTGETAPRRDLADLGTPPNDRHPAGRALPSVDRHPAGRALGKPVAPRLVVLPGGGA